MSSGARIELQTKKNLHAHSAVKCPVVLLIDIGALNGIASPCGERSGSAAFDFKSLKFIVVSCVSSVCVCANQVLCE